MGISVPDAAGWRLLLVFAEPGMLGLVALILSNEAIAVLVQHQEGHACSLMLLGRQQLQQGVLGSERGTRSTHARFGDPLHWPGKIWEKLWGHERVAMDAPASAPWPYLRPEFLQQLDRLVGEEIWPLDLPLLVGVQGRELQGGPLFLCLPHGLLKLLFVHQVLIVQEVVQRQAGVCGGRFGASLPPAFPLGAPCIPPTPPLLPRPLRGTRGWCP